MLMDMCLPMLDIYQSGVAPNWLKSHTNSWCPDFFQIKILSNVRTEIYLARRNIVSTEQSVRAFEKYISRLVLFTYPPSILFTTLYRNPSTIGILRWFNKHCSLLSQFIYFEWWLFLEKEFFIKTNLISQGKGSFNV